MSNPKKKCRGCKFCDPESFRDGFATCTFWKKWFESSEQTCYVEKDNLCSNFKRRR